MAKPKGRGKVKYQNVTKKARVNTKSDAKETFKAISKILGRPASKKAISRQAGKLPNVARGLDIEAKERKGVRTARPTTAKVPVKRSVSRRGGMRGGGIGSGPFGPRVR